MEDKQNLFTFHVLFMQFTFASVMTCTSLMQRQVMMLKMIKNVKMKIQTQKIKTGFDILPELKVLITKVRKIVKLFRKSPVKNDDILQPQVIHSFGKEKQLHFDTRTRWNSILKMLQRSYEMRKEIKMAMLELDQEFNLDDEDLTKIKELCETLTPLEMAVNYHCHESTDLILAENVVAFTFKKMSETKTLIENALAQSFEKRIQERRNENLIHLFSYLNSSAFTEKSND